MYYNKWMVKIVFNTLLGIVLIFIWSRFVNLGQIVSTIKTANPVYIVPIFIFLLLSPVIRALRLKIFLSNIKKIPFKDLIFLNGVAVMLNFFIPIRAGEIAKGVYLHSQYDLPLGKSVIWVFLDRFVDFLVVIILASAFFGQKAIVVLAVFFVVFLILLFLKKHIKSYFDILLDRSLKDLILMILLTILAYGADAAIWYFNFLALNSTQNFFKMYLGQMLSALTYLIPAAPGYVGSAEASGLLILSGVFGIEANLASAMTVLSHLLSAVFVLGFGLISVFSLKINLSVILKKALKRK